MSKKVKVEVLARDKPELIQILHQFICQASKIYIEPKRDLIKQRQWDSNKKIKKYAPKSEQLWIEKCQEIDKEYQLLLQKNPKAKAPQYPDKPEINFDEEKIEILIPMKEPDF